MDYNAETLARLASKYLNRVEVKGINEHHEFAYLLQFFIDLEQKTIQITKDEPPT